jgi:hypothetical protein
MSTVNSADKDLSCPQCDETSEFSMTVSRPVTEWATSVKVSGIEMDQQNDPAINWTETCGKFELRCASCDWRTSADTENDAISNLANANLRR